MVPKARGATEYQSSLTPLIAGAYLGGAAAACAGACTASILATAKVVGAVVGGAVAGFAGGVAGAAFSGAGLSDSLRAGLYGAASGAAFGAVGAYFQGVQGVAAHALTGGVLSDLQGGKFGHGFLSAGITKLASQHLISGIGGVGADRVFARTLIAGAVGGTVTELTGGKFANGARTAAFAHLFNQESQNRAAPESRAEDAQEGQTFAGRAEIYRNMQSQLEAAGVDTVWFGVAADLNEFFAGRAGLLLSSYEYMNELGISLLDHNTNMFNALMSGDLSMSGQALDNFLVQGEQMHVQSFTIARYGTSVPAAVRGPVNLAFSVGRPALASNIHSGVNYVERMYSENFNFWDTSHRITLGESMMSMARHGN